MRNLKLVYEVFLKNDKLSGCKTLTTDTNNTAFTINPENELLVADLSNNYVSFHFYKFT